ncbi:MAG: hypothetical protein RLZZ385_1378 [Pseudomonadota bacterium]|jgi:predicted ArsR family transcriptional regulator
MDIASSRQQILLQLKTRGPRTVKMLAQRLGMTTMGARQHLLELQQQGLVSALTETAGTRGRPRQVWKLTAGGHERFPDGHAAIAVGLLDLMEQHLPATSFHQIVDDLGHRELGRYQQALRSCANLEDRLMELTRLRSVDGYLAELRLLPDGNWLLIENHCPVYAAAARCRSLCEGECRLLEELLQPLATVERTELRLDGSRRCAFRISRAAADSRVQSQDSEGPL